MLLKKLDETENPGSPRVFQSDPKLKELAQKAKALKLDNFLSASELKLTERQRTALIKTLDLMEAEGISHKKFIGDKKFDMNTWIETEHKCGSVCCIGGTATLLYDGPNKDKNIYGGVPSIFHNEKEVFQGTKDLYNLFYHWGFRNPGVNRAAKQLRHYLETGECERDWADLPPPKRLNHAP